MPDVWTQIEKAAESIATNGQDKDQEAKKARVMEAARKIIASSSRSDIEGMIRSADEHLKRVKLPQTSYETRGYTWSIFTRVLLGHKEPHAYQQLVDNVSWHGLAVAAIDNHHDERSRDLLVELALKDEAFEWKRAAQDSWDGYDGSQVFTVYALGVCAAMIHRT